MKLPSHEVSINPKTSNHSRKWLGLWSWEKHRRQCGIGESTMKEETALALPGTICVTLNRSLYQHQAHLPHLQSKCV